jgi:hypothetical protein
MRRLAAAVCVVAMFGGCLTYRESRKAAGVGAVAAVASALMAVTLVADIPPSGSEGIHLFTLFILAPTAVILLPAGLVGMATQRRTHLAEGAESARLAREDARRDELKRAAAKARERAWSVTKQAAEAARAGDCATVADRDREVRELDAEFYEMVFVRDVAIEQCLETTADSASGEQPVAPIDGARTSHSDRGHD